MIDLDETFAYSALAEVTFDIPNEFNVYPNPSNGSIDITNKSKVSRVIITSLAGMVVFDGDPKTTHVKGLSSGLYVIKYQSLDGNTTTQKFAVQ